MAYSDKVLDHYDNPRNVGKLDDKASNVGTGMVGAPACGDVMRLQIQIDDDGVIEDANIYGDFFGVGDVTDIENLLKGVTYDKSAIASALGDFEITSYLGGITKEQFLQLIY